MSQMAKIGGLSGGGVERLTLSKEDKEARDLLMIWMRELGLKVSVDQVGNMYGEWGNSKNAAPVYLGSHLDTVGNGGEYDGSLGVLAGLEAIQTCIENNIELSKPIGLINFTNEEGVRFTPDMMGSLALKGGIGVEKVMKIKSVDKQFIFGEELEKIGYKGTRKLSEFKATAYLELHIEQGPVLESEQLEIGVVEMVQGISWNEIYLTGQSNHAGTTPMHLRKDAGYVAASIIQYARQLTHEIGDRQVATVGMVEVEPNLINVVPGRVRLTVDLRNTDDLQLMEAEKKLIDFAKKIAAVEGVEIEINSLVRFQPVPFDDSLIALVEGSAKEMGYSYKRMPSGAGHDAQMMAAICPSTMIFIPSKNGISHSVKEYSSPEDIEKGANVLLGTAIRLAE